MLVSGRALKNAPFHPCSLTRSWLCFAICTVTERCWLYDELRVGSGLANTLFQTRCLIQRIDDSACFEHGQRLGKTSLFFMACYPSEATAAYSVDINPGCLRSEISIASNPRSIASYQSLSLSAFLQTVHSDYRTSTYLR